LENLLKVLPLELNAGKEIFLKNNSGGMQYQYHSRFFLWFVRYIDSFIIGIRGKILIPRILKVLQFFLKERGLDLFEYSIKIKEMQIGTKFKFLG
jgi:hypothetical protein